MPTGVYKRKPYSQKWKDNISKGLKGKLKGIRRSPDSEIKKGQNIYSNHSEVAKKNGFGKWMTGRKQSPETRRKISEAHKGTKHWNWKPDRSKLKTGNVHKYDYKYRTWSMEIKNRDGWKCKIKNSDCSGRLEAHHILPWSQYPELRYDINNGISLCLVHHPRTRIGEQKSAPFFKMVLSAI